MKIAVFVGSIREGRAGIAVGEWALDQLASRNDGHDYELLDLAKHDLVPVAGIPPRMVEGEYSDPKTQQWAETVGGYDAFIFVTSEHNASVPGFMKNAFDLLFKEWTKKPVGFIGYGGAGAQRAVSHWRDIVSGVGMIAVPTQAAFSFAEHFPARQFVPGQQGKEWINIMANELDRELAKVSA
ncbi:NADPH-dependent FMN reductase [Corynebacterium alimapuense]|uniref:NADPH-dependent oxidoreductase n=1 Tax=Corynebacterium alimapuense TaxID=1576874 RepID=A0A3M8K8H6_9CORY|nr:NAD(P)H-dependent oxidoreductase [Corynebacterium alimapuense]RNE49533.1 NADPH-dependent oxidoreductase [Corynebacterium alimapuense]